QGFSKCLRKPFIGGSRRMDFLPATSTDSIVSTGPSSWIGPPQGRSTCRSRSSPIPRRTPACFQRSVMPLPAQVDRELLLGMLLAREALQSTGIGDGIAIPHVRNPIVLHVAHPS